MVWYIAIMICDIWNAVFKGMVFEIWWHEHVCEKLAQKRWFKIKR